MTRAHHIAADVIETEIAGLAALAEAMRESGQALARAFETAAKTCGAVKGRLIVTGMGKSGHVARKIAATLASTGAPASFVHPAEASHGDLGMISRHDVIIALSNSGETPELGDVIAYAGRFDIPLIAVTSGEDSTLARASDIRLILPPAREACAVTRAPTTSTAMMLALGDALAVAILQNKGFTASDFHNFHPGGKLGAALKRVTDLMHHKEMPLCSPEDTAEHAVAAITAAGFGCAGAIDADGKLVGIVTDGDLRRHYGKSFSDAQVRDIMTPGPQVVTEDSLAAEALALFSERKITAVFIVDKDHKPLGLLHVHDCLSIGVI